LYEPVESGIDEQQAVARDALFDRREHCFPSGRMGKWLFNGASVPVKEAFESRDESAWKMTAHVSESVIWNCKKDAGPCVLTFTTMSAPLQSQPASSGASTRATYVQQHPTVADLVHSPNSIAAGVGEILLALTPAFSKKQKPVMVDYADRRMAIGRDRLASMDGRVSSSRADSGAFDEPSAGRVLLFEKQVWLAEVVGAMLSSSNF